MRRQPISDWESPQPQVTCPSARITPTPQSPTIAIPYTPSLIHLIVAAICSAATFAHFAVPLTAQPEESGSGPRLWPDLPAMRIAGSAARPVNQSRRIARNIPIPPFYTPSSSAIRPVMMEVLRATPEARGLCAWLVSLLSDLGCQDAHGSLDQWSVTSTALLSTPSELSLTVPDTAQQSYILAPRSGSPPTTTTIATLLQHILRSIGSDLLYPIVKPQNTTSTPPVLYHTQSSR